MRTKFLQTICLLSLMIALPSLALGDNLTVKITAGGSSTTQTAQPSLEAALNGISLPTVTAIEVSAGTFTEADWLYLRTKNIAEVGLIALANFSITDGVDAVADMPNTDGEHPFFSSMLSTFSAHKLQKVGKYAFYNCSKMSNVNMPDVVTVDDHAFCNTTGLKQINLPQLETIIQYAFVNCGIESLTLPKAKTIGNYAFMGAGNLTTLKLPSVTEFTAQKLFYGSALTYLGLNSIPNPINNNTFEGAPSPRYLLMIDANGNALNSSDSTTLANYFGNEWQGFKTDHSRVQINLNIEYLDGKITRTKNYNTGTTLSEALTNTGVAISAITKITITAGEILATDWLWLRNNKNYFSKLTHFTVTDGITAVSNIPSSNASVLKAPLAEFSVAKLNILGTRALYSIASLLKVNLPNATTIEQQVFSQCTRLHDVSIPQVTTLQGRAFNNCGSLTTLHLPKITSLKEPNIFDGSALTYLKLGATPISITGNVLEGCPSPRFVVLVDENGNPLTGAESNYTGHTGYKNNLWYGFRVNGTQEELTVKIELNNGTTAFDLDGSTLENAISPVSNKASITSIEIVAGEITAADWVYLCKLMKELNDIKNNNLKKLIIANVPEVIAVSDIPAANNYYNIQGSNLEEVSLAKVERIGYYAFTKNTSLKKAFFPHVKRIDTYSFTTCSSLDTISLPQIKEFNGNGVFSGSNVMAMKIGATPPVADKVSKGAFNGSSDVRFLIFCDSNGELLSGPDLDNAKDAYRNDAGYDRSTKQWYGWNIDNTSDSLEVIINNQYIIKETHIIACLDSAAKLGVGRNAIESIEVTKGNFTASDWSRLSNNRGKLNNLKKFVISNTITSVAVPNDLHSSVTGDDLYLPPSVEEVHIAKLSSIGQYVFQGARDLKYLSLPNLIQANVSTFKYMPKLQKISLPMLQHVRGYFLYDCPQVKILQIGSSPISMESYFSGPENNSNVNKCIQIVGSNGVPLTGQALENAKINYKNDVSNYNKNEYGNAHINASGKWRGWILGTTVKISTEDVENGSLSVPLDLVLRDTLSDNTISINISADANYRLKEGSLRAYNTDDESEEVTINGNNTFTLPDFDVTITAEFEPITYEIIATANPTEGGSIGGTGTFIQGASTMLTATPNEGYNFVGWTENGATYSTEASISIADIAANRTFVAEFEQKTYTLTYIAGANGTLEGGSPQTQPVVHGQNANPVEAKADPGYHFKKWSDGSTVNPRILENVTKDSTITAEFEQDTKTFEITATAEPTEGGSVNGGGTYNENTTATLTATANAKDGYKFVGWEENGNVESTDAEYSFTVKSNRTLVARFEKITYTLTYTAGDGGKIKHNGAEQKEVILSVEHGADGEEVEAVAENGYKFIGWSDGGSNAVRTDKGIIENKTITAEFELEVVPTFNIIAEAYPAEGGTIDGDGTLNENSTAELVATPNHGYFFVEWTENGASISTENTLSFSVTQDRNLTAVFDSITYTLTYTASEGGSINGELTQQVKFTKNGTEVVAVPNVGYRFVGWSDIAATTPNRTDYNVRGNVDATAMFELIPPTHTIAVTVNPLDAGSVNGAGDYEEGQTATLSATASIGFEFESWFDGVNTITDNPYSFAVTEPRNIVAQFKATNVYTVTATANPAEGGVIVGDGQYNENATATLTATPNEGYRFVMWLVNGLQVSSNSIHTFTVTDNIELTAEFELIPTFTVTAIADPVEGGTISGNGTYYENEEVVLTAIPAAHYKFVSWKLDGSEVSTSKQYTIDHITSNYNNGELVAEFEYDATITVYTITATAEPTEGGSVSGDGVYNENAPATLVATANEGYRFVRWTVAGNEVSTNANFSFTVTSDSTFVAEFEVVPTYTITVDATPAEGGSVSGGGTYNENTTATLTATASNGYKFVRWTVKGVEVSIEPSFSVKVTADSTFVAEFVEDGSIVTVTYAINIGTFENGSVTADKMEAAENDVVTLTVSPAANYRLNEIKVNDGAIVVTPTENGNVYTFIMPAMDVTVTAVFEEIPCYAEPSEFTAIACQNYEWDGRTYTESGDYPWTYTTAAGCDSTVTLHLTIGQPQTGEFTAFYTNSYEWEGETYTESGDYTRTFTTVAGCDSIVTLHLTITHSEETSVNVAVAETLNIYPNPTAGVVQVDMPSADASEVLVFNANGQLLQIIKTQGQAQARIDLSELPSGMYFVRIGNALGKVVKQ